jgi:protein-S-isoprenylcysteine O-methyltransferase Ste14
VQNLLLFYAIFFTVAMVVPTVRVWRSTGVNPLVMPSDDSVEGFAGRMFKLVIVGLGVYLVLGALGLISDDMARFPALDFSIFRQVGWTLLGLSLIWVIIAQAQMGASWRVGIDAKIKTDLVSRGLFRFSRNPIFLGMMAQMFGLFLVLPNGIMLSVLIAAFVLISVQIRLEEAHLLALHGEAYAAFCGTVRRWL